MLWVLFIILKVTESQAFSPKQRWMPTMFVNINRGLMQTELTTCIENNSLILYTGFILSQNLKIETVT